MYERHPGGRMLFSVSFNKVDDINRRWPNAVPLDDSCVNKIWMDHYRSVCELPLQFETEDVDEEMLVEALLNF